MHVGNGHLKKSLAHAGLGSRCVWSATLLTTSSSLASYDSCPRRTSHQFGQLSIVSSRPRRLLQPVVAVARPGPRPLAHSPHSVQSSPVLRLRSSVSGRPRPAIRNSACSPLLSSRAEIDAHAFSARHMYVRVRIYMRAIGGEHRGNIKFNLHGYPYACICSSSLVTCYSP